MKTKERTSLRLKVITGFGILSVILVVVVCLSYTNFNRLFQSVEYLSRPQDQEEKLTNIYQNIHLSQKYIQLYTSTAEDNYYTQYQSTSDEIKNSIGLLRKRRHFFSYKVQLDSIEKLQMLKDLLAEELRKLIQKRDSMQLSLHRIALKTDTVYFPTVETETTQVNYIRIIPQEIRKEEEEKKGFFKRLFSGKDKKTEQENGDIPALAMEEKAELRIDTNIAFKAVTQSNLEEVKQQLNHWEFRNQKITKTISKEEKDLLQNNDVITGLIKKIITHLEKQERSEKEKNLQKAGLMVRNSTYTIGIIGISGLGGCFLLLLLITKDIRLSNIYKSKLAAEKKKAEKLAKVKEQFLSNMSHEIRTPLGAIIGFSEQLDRTSLLPEQKKYLSAIKNSSDHLLSLVNDILDLSKIEAGKMTIEKTAFQVFDIVYDVYQNLKMKADEKKLRFSFYIDPSIPHILSGDSFRLKQVLFNLVGNAIKFTEEGYVELSLKPFSVHDNVHLIQIQIKDTGVGIPANKQKTIFEKFEQVSVSDTRKYGGTGLGLSITQNLIHLMGGTIHVESEVGKGSSFQLLVPFDKALAEPAVITPSRETTNFIQVIHKEILIVEDDPFISDLMRVIFTKHQIKTHFAVNGKDGYKAFREKSFDVVITDMQMPGFTGLDLINKIRKNSGRFNKNIPIILCTANVLDTSKYQEHRHLHFLTKPFKEQELIQAVSMALSGENNSVKIHTEIEMDVNSNNKYSLSLLREIIKDESEWIALLEKIITNGRSSIEEMQQCREKGDLKRIVKIAHKLIPTYRHLQADEIVTQLEMIETCFNENKEEEIIPRMEKVVPELSELLSELEKDQLSQNH